MLPASLSAQLPADSSATRIGKPAPPVQDSTRQDSLLQAAPPALQDTTAALPKKYPYPLDASNYQELIYKKAFPFGFEAEETYEGAALHQYRGKELLFYALTGLLLVFSLLRSAFAKYIHDLFRLFFRTTIKQRQITEQLSQTPLPSLLFNVFFLVTGGLYTDFVLQHFQLAPVGDFWLMFVYAAGALGAIYSVKFLSLKFLGWVFNVSSATDAYIFIVFVINKVIGIFLLPFLVLIAFTSGGLYQVAMVLSWCVIGSLFIYRFFLSFSAVRNQIKVRPFHFLLYLLAFEIAPLLLIYKLLLHFLM